MRYHRNPIVGRDCVEIGTSNDRNVRGAGSRRGGAAEVTLNSVRVAAVDTVALAKFYQAAFGMLEVNRISLPAGPEIFVNFGATAEAAKANKGCRSSSFTVIRTP